MWRKYAGTNSKGSSSQQQSRTPSCSSSFSVSGILAECCTAAAKPELAPQLQQHYQDVGSWKSKGQLPIVYHPNYNTTLFGVEKLHPFDSCKFEKVVAGLKATNIITSNQQLVQPLPVSHDVLSQVHSQEYLTTLHTSSVKVAQVTELAPLALLPHFLVDRKVLQPMRTHVGGTVLAAALAVVQGWAVNLGGGMHHAHWSDGSGWCPYADITLAVERLRTASAGAVQRVMVVDLDAHQGNGVERDKLQHKDKDMYILDMYNAYTFPWDTPAKKAIDVKVELQPGTSGDDYLSSLREALKAAASEFPDPQLIVYNAGTDILAGDPLGRLAVSAEAVKQRDAAVFELAEQLKCPIVMLLSGGYTKRSAGVIVDSLTSLLQGMATKVKPAQQPAPAGSS